MDQRDRRDDEQDRSRSASNPESDDASSRDDLSRRREEAGSRPPLTRRERDERWPIG